MESVKKYNFNIVCSEDKLGNGYNYTRVKLEDQNDREKIIKLHGSYFGSYSLSIMNNILSFNLWIEKEKYNPHEGNFFHIFTDGELYKEESIPLQNVRMKVTLNGVCEYTLALFVNNDEWIALPITSFAESLNLKKYYNKKLDLYRKDQFFANNKSVYYITKVAHNQTELLKLLPFSFPICNDGKAQFQSASSGLIDIKDKKIIIEKSPKSELSIYLADQNGRRVSSISGMEVNLIDYLNASLKAVLLKNSNIREVLSELEIDDDLDIDKRQLKCLLDKILMQNERILVNNPNLQEVIAKKLRENPGNIKGPKGEQGPRGFNGTEGIIGRTGQKGDQGLKGDMGPVGPKGEQGPRGFNGTEGITGNPGQKGDQGLKGNMGPKGEKGIKGADGTPGKDGKPGIHGEKGTTGGVGPKGDKGDTGLVGMPGTFGLPGRDGLPGPQGLKGEDGIGAVEADQFLYEMNKTKLEIQNTQKAVEAARNISQRFAKEAHDAKNQTTELYAKVVKLHNITEVIKKDAQKFASHASTSKQNTEALYGQVKNMFCGIKPTDPVCTSQRRTRETRNSNNQPVTSGAGRPTSFISQIINFFYSSIKQDKYKIENNIHELNQVVRIVDAANVVLKFEKVLEEAASRCGIPKKHLNLDPIELQSAIVSRSLLDDENCNEMLKFLCEVAKKSCPNYKQADTFLALFKENMKRTLVNNEQQRGCISTEETATDNSQPRSFMSNIIPPTSLSSISQMAVGYLR